MDTTLPSQPSTYSQIIKASLRLYRTSFSRIILLSLILSITVFIPRFVSVFVGQDLFLNMPPLSLHRIWIFAINLISLTFLIGIIWRMHCIMRGAHEPLIEDLNVGIRKLVYVLIASIIQSFILFTVFLAVIGSQALLNQYNLLFSQQLISIIFTVLIFFVQFLFICYISTLFIFLIPLIAIENKGVIGSLRHSVLLVWNHWWHVFSVQVTPWITYMIVLVLIRFALHIDIHIYFMRPTKYTLLPTLFHVVLFAIYIPWVAATLLVQLKDIELRKKINTETQ